MILLKKGRLKTMALVEFETKEFKRVGRVTAGEEVQKYTANQIKTFPSDSPQNILEAALEVAGGDLKKVSDYFVLGANHMLRLDAGGYSPLEKAARGLIKSGLQPFASMSLEQVIAVLEAQAK